MILRVEGNSNLLFQPVERNFTENLQQRVSAMGRTTWEALQGQSLLITFLFFSIWGGVSFVFAVQAAVIYVIGRIVYLAWKERGLQAHIADQNHHIALLQQNAARAAGEVARLHQVNCNLQETYRTLTQKNEALFQQNTQLAAKTEQLQLHHTLLSQDKKRDTQMQEAKLSAIQSQLKREQEKVQTERDLRLALENLVSSLQEKIAQLQLTLEKTQAECAQEQVPLSFYQQMNEQLARIGNYLSGEQPDLLPPNTKQLLDLLRQYKEESLRLIRSEIELLPPTRPARFSLVAIEAYLAQENQVLGQLMPLLFTKGKLHATRT